MSELTVVQARELIERSPFERRTPTPEFVQARLAARRRRILSGRRLRDLDPIELWREFLPIAGAASSFNVVLDTTAPAGAALALNGNAAYATSRDITAQLTTSDSPTTGYQILIWGDVDAAYNASIQPTQGASAWITPASFPANQAVRVSTGDGLKTINARIRDDVWNETATLTKTITLDTTVPVVSITVGPDATKVSTVAGKRTVNFSFQANEDIVAWEVAIVANSSSVRGSGTVIGTTNGSTNTTGGALAATTNQAVTLDARDISAASAGDGTKVVKVFVQDTAGNWSTA